MKIKAIEAICKQHKHITLYNTERGQWIGVGSAAYPLNSLPQLTEENLLSMFDIPEDKRSKYYVDKKSELPSAYDFSDSYDGESLLDLYPLEICTHGGIVTPVVTSLGVIYINKKQLKPFEDIERGVDLYERVNDAGQLYIAVKQGFTLCGIILPLNIITEQFTKSLCKLADLTAVSYINAQERGGQMDITEVLELDEE